MISRLISTIHALMGHATEPAPSTPREAGYQAGQRDGSTNPYPATDPRNAEWEAGHRHAVAERQWF